MISHIFTLSMVVMCVMANKEGPPIAGYSDLCKTMTPQHDSNVPQSSMSPYVISMSKSCFKGGDTVKVYVYTKTQGAVIEGVFVQARTAAADDTDVVGLAEALGSYETSNAKLQTLGCFDGSNNALAHKGEPKQHKIEFMWTAPAGLTTDIKFIATVVKKKAEFWTGIQSTRITYKADTTGCDVATPIPSDIPTDSGQGSDSEADDTTTPVGSAEGMKISFFLVTFIVILISGFKVFY